MNLQHHIGFLLFILATHTQAAVTSWSAASGLLPDELNSPWEFFETADTEEPTLTSSFVTLSTDDGNELMVYIQRGPEITMPPTLVIEAELRFVSGTGENTAVSPVAIGFISMPSIGNSLFIEKDTIFLQSAHATRGPEVSIDTDDAFHTYKIVLDGRESGSSIQVYQDDLLVLTGASFTEVTATPGPPTVFFGHGFRSVDGSVSEWRSLSHNAATAIPEPSTSLLSVFGITAFLLRRKR